MAGYVPLMRPKELFVPQNLVEEYAICCAIYNNISEYNAGRQIKQQAACPIISNVALRYNNNFCLYNNDNWNFVIILANNLELYTSNFNDSGYSPVTFGELKARAEKLNLLYRSKRRTD